MHTEGGGWVGGWVGGRVDTLRRGTFAIRPSHYESPGVQDKQLLQLLLWQCLRKRAGLGGGTPQVIKGFAC